MAETTTYKVIGTRPIRHDGVDKVTGRAIYGADVQMAGLLHGKVLRSPHAHARIRSISTEAAAKGPGVLLTLTAADWERAGHGELTVVHPMPFGDGRPMNCSPRPAFARDKVHHVGDIIGPHALPSRNSPDKRNAFVQQRVVGVVVASLRRGHPCSPPPIRFMEGAVCDRVHYGCCNGAPRCDSSSALSVRPCGRTTTRAPTGTRPNKSTTSWLRSRMQPLETF